MRIAFSCPKCRAVYQVPGEFAGRTTTCRTCGTAMRVPGGAVVDAPSGPLSKAATPAIIGAEPLKRCPYCGEQILAVAKKCKHCRETLDEALRAIELPARQKPPAADPPDPPTEKQRRYAAKIGIDVQATMSKAELSAAIADAERRNPELAEQRERVKSKVREKKFGKEVIDQEDRWNRFAYDFGYMLAVYNRGNETIVDVLRVNEAFIDDRGKLKLGVEGPKLVKDRDIGDYIDWDKHFELPIESLLYHEPLHSDFDSEGNNAYRKVVEKGLTIARSL